MFLIRRVCSISIELTKRSIPLQILSDLHLEVGQQYSLFDFPRAAPYLILAGDIGRLSSDYSAYLSFLSTRCCSRFDYVFLVLGNHEFYGSSHDEVLDIALSKLEREPILRGRLMVLHRRRVDIPGIDVTILGCTLHSRISPGAAREAVQSKVKDFQRIEGWTVDDHNAEHEKDVTWLRREVERIHEEEKTTARGRRRRVVVVTHYAPCVHGTSDPRHVNNAWNSAFATDLLPDMTATATSGFKSQPSPFLGVQWWVFGHTHFTTHFQRDGIIVVSNQRGYTLPSNISGSEGRKRKGHAFVDTCRSIGHGLIGGLVDSSNRKDQFRPNKTILV